MKQPSSNKPTNLSTNVNVEMNIENKDFSMIGKRKINQDETNDKDNEKIKRDKPQQFACQR